MKLTIEANQVIYEMDPRNKWVMDIGKIKFIGEDTTANGPWEPDYFFVFAEKENEWWQAPNEAVKEMGFWTQLSEKLNCEVGPTLAASTQWATKVLYPVSLAGQEMFEIIQIDQKSKSFWQRIFGSAATERLVLTENVRKLFHQG
ncbi:hypothetical protein [Rufibacter sp. LB8]|uniref:hypothetical protein n=1 Tax=Rufibacter sp. LB8 TaxID=2777781 RepID=UPI00178C5F5D|nr:hypothetical protein [Rufibacter sp. LB8]